MPLRAPLGARLLGFPLITAVASWADALVFSFQGLIQNSPGSGVVPLDTMGSVNPNFFFETLNSQFQAFNNVTPPVLCKRRA
jgi:hypothetical protein